MEMTLIIKPTKADLKVLTSSDTMQEVAEVLGVTRQRLWIWTSNGVDGYEYAKVLRDRANQLMEQGQNEMAKRLVEEAISVAERLQR